MSHRPISESRAAGLCFAVVVVLAVAFGSAAGQEQISRKRVNPYSPNPAREIQLPRTDVTPPIAFRTVSQPVNEPREIARPTETAPKTPAAPFLAPTDTYTIGVGDVLLIDLRNAPAGRGYHTVRTDGTIDFPLAGAGIVVAGNTVETIAETIASRITLYPDPQVDVKVREYGSHRISVSGLVDRAGEKNLQRDAIPLFVVRAEAVVERSATMAVVKRAPLLKPEIYDLRDPKTDDVLIYPGNAIEFTDNAAHASYYFISGKVRNNGQKEFSPGLTLYQAAVAAGLNGSPRKATIRRKTGNGVLALTEHDLKAIRDGKAADQPLTAGDVIEIRN